MDHGQAQFYMFSCLQNLCNYSATDFIRLLIREWSTSPEKVRREIEKLIIRQPPIGEKDDYDSENF